MTELMKFLMGISLAFRKCKKDCHILKIILVFCVHLKLKLLDFLWDFVLILYSVVKGKLTFSRHSRLQICAVSFKEISKASRTSVDFSEVLRTSMEIG